MAVNHLHNENDSTMRIAVEEKTRPFSVSHLFDGDSGCGELSLAHRNAEEARVVKYNKNTINKNCKNTRK